MSYFLFIILETASITWVTYPGSVRKQGLGISPIVQQNQEFSIQNEDFPALPGFKGARYFVVAFNTVSGLIHSIGSSKILAEMGTIL